MLEKPKSLLECSDRRELADLLEVELPTLTFFAFSHGKRYRSFTIPKKSGGLRTIKAPTGGLLEMQRKLAKHLNEIYPQPINVQGFVAGGSILKNASPHLNKKVLLNIDLDNFFPTITSNRVIGLLRSRPFNFNNEVASTIAGLVCHNGTLPQGAPTSPVLSNMICLRMDRALISLSKRAGATYTRYADDITFSTRKNRFKNSIVNKQESEDVVILGQELLKIISDNYFSINTKKTRLSYGNKPKFVTGVKVNLYPNVSRRYVRQVRSMLHAWEIYGLKKAQKEFTVKYGGGGKSYIQVLRGRLAHLRSIKSDNDLTYRRLYNRFVELEGTGKPKLHESAIEELNSKVFIVQSGVQQGTGFILDNKWLVTCSHVAETDEIRYYTYENSSMPMLHRRLSVDSSHRSPVDGGYDLVVTPINNSDTFYNGKSFESPAEDVRVNVGMIGRAVGFPAYIPGAAPNIMTIEVTGLRDDKYGIQSAYVDKKLISGFSGSPVISDQNNIIGIVQRGTKNLQTGDDSAGYTFLPIQEIRNFLNSLETPSET